MRKHSAFFILAFCIAALTSKSAPASFQTDTISHEICRQTETLVQLTYDNLPYNSFSVRSTAKDVLHFYIFDTAGILTLHALLLPGNKRTISGLNKGNYDYEIYQHNECIEQGKIKVCSEDNTNMQPKS